MAFISCAQLVLLTVSAFAVVSRCASAALSVTPSINWYGDDGDWSAVSLRIGTPQQWVDVIPNTQSSETWVVDVGGCGGNSICTSSRGGVFNPSASSTWQPLGFFELGSNANLGNTGYAAYGLDSLTFGSTGAWLPSSLIGTVNGTNYTWLGSLGLGILPGNFSGRSPLSVISALVETHGVIHSHSYGYTAGAKYRQKGVPTSLTFGGYDENRMVQHNVSFQLNPSQQPQVFVNSMTVLSSVGSTNWSSPSQLLFASDRINAIVDSSTPYLWLPASVCERIASSLGLSYNNTLNLYTFDGNLSQHNVLKDSRLTFTLTISDSAASNDLVNIILPYQAFDLQLTYPAIPNTTYGSAESTKSYFPLRRATNEAQYRLGRAFLQEAYLITNYETNTFSVHQASHPVNPLTNTSIVAITRDPSTNLTGSPPKSNKLSTGAVVGIVIGAVSALLILLGTIFCLRRRRRDKETQIEEKDFTSTETRSIVDRLLRRQRPPLIHEATGSTAYATEVGADASHERFELPAPLGPVELDSEMGTLGGRTTDNSPENTDDLSSYEYARRKLERQQRIAAMQGEKTENDASHVAHYRPSDHGNNDSMPVSPLAASEGSMSIGQPSPMDSMFGLQENAAPPSYRRINPANVVYVGRMPSDIQLPDNVPKVVGRDGRTIHSEASSPPGTVPSDGPLSVETQYGDNDLYVEGNGNQRSTVSPLSSEAGSRGNNIAGAQGHRGNAELRDMLDPMGSRQRLDGEDLVHIPQPAENRFSFEEERISGNTQ